MDDKRFHQRCEEYRAAVEETLLGLFLGDPPYGTLYEAMRYSVLSGGKRLRPMLTLEFARVCGLDWRRALPFACALELVHTYSLIHDDLPCMDNDTLRRGKPTNHVVFGETMATLAGDALQPEAYRLLLSADLSDKARADGALALALASGADGMVAGQVLDLSNCSGDEQKLRLLHSLKTGAMIAGACELGCIAADAPQELRERARRFGAALGLAFQIRDDMLDVIGDEKTFGKPIGSDDEQGKTTFVSLLGLAGCAQEVERATEEALAALDGVPESDFLATLARSLATRNK